MQASIPSETPRWLFEETNKASDNQLKTYRLTSFNEKIQILLSKVLQTANSFEEISTEGNLIKDPAYIAPHLKVGHGVVRQVVLTVGDPFRCEQIAKKCEKSEEIAWNREYRMYNITYEGVELTCVSHGIGGPGAAICFEELVKLGATTIFRLGTCGSLQPDKIKQGHLIVSSACCREDGHSGWMVPQGFPAVADPRLVTSLLD